MRSIGFYCVYMNVSLCFLFYHSHAENALVWNNFCVQRKRLCILNELKNEYWRTATISNGENDSAHTYYIYEYIIYIGYKKISSYFIWKWRFSVPYLSGKQRERGRKKNSIFFSCLNIWCKQNLFITCGLVVEYGVCSMLTIWLYG